MSRTWHSSSRNHFNVFSYVAVFKTIFEPITSQTTSGLWTLLSLFLIEEERGKKSHVGILNFFSLYIYLSIFYYLSFYVSICLSITTFFVIPNYLYSFIISFYICPSIFYYLSICFLLSISFKHSLVKP